MLRGMIASTYRIIIVLYRRFDLRRRDLHHRFANFSWRLVSCDLNDGDISILASKRIRKCLPDEGVIHGVHGPWITYQPGRHRMAISEIRGKTAACQSVASGKVPAPFRVRLKRVNCDQAIPYPPDGQTCEWWDRLKNAFGTASRAFVGASLQQLIAAARLPGPGSAHARTRRSNGAFGSAGLGS
jgi:hypothetical protein